MRELPNAVRRLWRFSAVTVAAVLAVGGYVFLVVGTFAVGPVPGWAWAVPAAIGGAALAVGLLLADALYKSWRFGLSEDAVEARWGVVSKSRAVVPRNRVQTVTTEDGPIDRWLGLSTITVHTAGARTPNLRIPHLETETVAWIRRELAGGFP